MKKLKRHIFTHARNIVVGGDVASLLWAFKNDYWVVFTNPTPPYWFERFPSGIPKEQIWDWLILQLNYRGKILGAYPNKTIRTEENILKIMTEGNTLLNYEFDNVVVTNGEMLENSRPKEIVDRRALVLDKYNLSSQRHDHVYYWVGDELINEIHFYKEPFSMWKKIDVVSFLRESQINSFDYDLVALRYKLQGILKQQLGMKGSKNGTKVGDLPLRTHHLIREIKFLENHKYHNEKNVRFITVEEDKLWNDKTEELWEKWSASFRWMDTNTTKNFRMLLG